MLTVIITAAIFIMFAIEAGAKNGYEKGFVYFALFLISWIIGLYSTYRLEQILIPSILHAIGGFSIPLIPIGSLLSELTTKERVFIYGFIIPGFFLGVATIALQAS